MDLKLFATVFATIFAAELADKTQFATLLFASNAEHSKLTVFIGSALALVVASALAVFAGAMLSHWLKEKLMVHIAGVAFVIVGVCSLARS